MKDSVNWNHFWRERHSKPSRQCYFEGKKNCDPKVAKRHYKEEATLSTSRLRQHDETHLRYCILASNVTWDTTSGRKLWHLHRPRNKKETLRCMKKGKPRGAKIGVDLFEIKGRNYLVTVDYYSNCLKVDYLSTTMTKQVITKLKGHCDIWDTPTDGNWLWPPVSLMRVQEIHDGVGSTTCKNIITWASPVKWTNGGRSEDNQNNDV